MSKTQKQTKAAQPTPTQDVPTQRRVFSLQDEQYFVDSLDKDNLNAINQIDELVQKIKGFEIEIRDNRYAQQYLIDFLTKHIETFEKVPVSTVVPADIPTKEDVGE